jgi:hypothetical protein
VGAGGFEVLIANRKKKTQRKPKKRRRLLLRSGVVGHALGGDPPYQRGRRLLPPYAARLVAFGFLLFLLFIKL